MKLTFFSSKLYIQTSGRGGFAVSNNPEKYYKKSVARQRTIFVILYYVAVGLSLPKSLYTNDGRRILNNPLTSGKLH